jgi:hypothetical protein
MTARKPGVKENERPKLVTGIGQGFTELVLAPELEGGCR